MPTYWQPIILHVVSFMFSPLRNVLSSIQFKLLWTFRTQKCNLQDGLSFVKTAGKINWQPGPRLYKTEKPSTITGRRVLMVWTGLGMWIMFNYVGVALPRLLLWHGRKGNPVDKKHSNSTVVTVALITSAEFINWRRNKSHCKIFFSMYF